MADRPFVAEPPGDIEAATMLARDAAALWGLPVPGLLRVGMNALFTAGPDVVIRVGKPTADPQGAIRLAGVLSAHGVRMPHYVRDRAVVLGPLAATAIEYHDQVASLTPLDWAEVGAMVARVHAVDSAEVDGFYPVPHCSTFPWWDLHGLLAEVKDLLDPPARSGLQAALHRHAGWYDNWRSPAEADVVLCHGDVHPGNVLVAPDGPMLIDWDLLCTGPAAWDHAPLMTWTQRWGGESGVYERFAEGYGRSLRGDPAAEAIAELRLVAATLMRVRAGRVDAAAAAEAERRLRWWRSEPGAPPWRAA